MKTKIITLVAVVMFLGVCPVQAGVWWIDGHLEINEGDVELTITGYLMDGSYFVGTDNIRVIDKGRKL